MRTGMIYGKNWLRDATWLHRTLVVILVLVAGCGGSERLSPTPDSPSAAEPAQGDSIGVAPTDSAAGPVDSTSTGGDSLTSGFPSDPGGVGAATSLASGTQPGIVFGSYGMEPGDLNSVHTGMVRGGGVTADNVLAFLSAVRAKGGRMVLKMCMGEDKYVKNSDGTFSLTKWKGLVDRFKNVNLGPYISDGTLLGHFLIDEPHRTARWGGKIISQATVEAMAQYSKQLWPTMPTYVRVVPSWLAGASITYKALDAGWLQYASGKGDPAKLVASETAIAKNKGLGLVIGLNILDGGNGSSGVSGWSKGKYAMSAAEIRSYGTALLSESYACGFFNWTYQFFGPTYYARSDIKSALADLSSKARAHVRTSCRQ